MLASSHQTNKIGPLDGGEAPEKKDTPQIEISTLLLGPPDLAQESKSIEAPSYMVQRLIRRHEGEPWLELKLRYSTLHFIRVGFCFSAGNFHARKFLPNCWCGPLSQSHIQAMNNLSSMGMLNDVNSNDGAPFDRNDFPQLTSRPNSAGGTQGQLGKLGKFQ
ncbi:hypothetical protein RHGRI_014348 [Rhododendron griersonianum]|uniref:Uncharacterized protein n=1 Tax=Rhododendron griersonianum TaxID=479676 RepID=A0AAV6K9B7_9ERIC|nr:hypothetical protein RHGRI_014348 [Rhododendron griersonianum]